VKDGRGGEGRGGEGRGGEGRGGVEVKEEGKKEAGELAPKHRNLTPPMIMKYILLSARHDTHTHAHARTRTHAHEHTHIHTPNEMTTT
jgi:hypothetical protein